MARTEKLQPSKRRRSCCRRPSACVAGFIFLFAIAFVVGAAFFFARVFTKHDHDPIANCNDCHCIVSGNATCPVATKPQDSFPVEVVEKFAKLNLSNPFELNCNPFKDEACQTSPQLTTTNLTDVGDETVCALRYGSIEEGEECASDYTMVTYDSTDEAKAEGAFVTHTGACGVCSTTQDLAAYMRTADITSATKKCAKFSLLRGNARRNCITELGLTQACGDLWMYKWTTVAEKCLLQCTNSELRDEPNNIGDQCELNGCMQCIDDIASEVFTKFAGRTKRRSGLLSAIARPCEEISLITHEACPKAIAVSLAQERSNVDEDDKPSWR